jgi:hypothetical protein
MPKKAYLGIGDKARRIKKAYIGVNGVARRIKKAYIGVNGVARLCFTSNAFEVIGELIEAESLDQCPVYKTCVVPATPVDHEYEWSDEEGSYCINCGMPSDYITTEYCYMDFVFPSQTITLYNPEDDAVTANITVDSPYFDQAQLRQYKGWFIQTESGEWFMITDETFFVCVGVNPYDYAEGYLTIRFILDRVYPATKV